MIVWTSRYFAWKDAAMTGQVPDQRPEGRLIEDARKAAGLSVRQAAPLAGISEARWRQLVKGSMPVAGGGVSAQAASPRVLARMASVVGVTAEQLEGVARPDAAEVLRLLNASAQAGTAEGAGEAFNATVRTGRPAGVDDEIDLIYRSQSMTARQKLDAIRMVLKLRLQAEADDCPKGTGTQAGAKPPANSH